MLSKAWRDITAACGKLDHAVKAIRLRCAEGWREPSSKTILRVT